MDLFQRRPTLRCLLGGSVCGQELFGQSLALAARGQEISPGLVELGGARLQLDRQLLGRLARLRYLGARATQV